jgi:hypothetical protein
MAASIHVGTFLTGTGAAGTTVAVTGCGFVPTGVIFFGIGLGSSTGNKQDASPTFGAMDAAGNVFSVAGESDDGSADADCNTFITAQDCFYLLTGDGAGTLYGSFKYKSMDADGFTVEIVDAFAATRQVSYIAIGGASVLVGTDTTRTTTGTKTTTTGFVPTAVMLFGTFCTAVDTVTADLNISVGLSGGPDDEGVVAAFSDNGAGTMDTAHYLYNGESLALFGSSTTLTTRAELQSFDSTTFTLNYLEVDGTARFFGFVAISGLAFAMDAWEAPADTSSKAITGESFQPVGVIAIGAAHTEGAAATQDIQAQDTAVVDGVLNFGAADAASNYATMQILDVDGAATSVILAAHYSTLLLSGAKVTGGAFDSDFTADLDSYDAGGITIDVLTNDVPSTPTFIAFLLQPQFQATAAYPRNVRRNRIMGLVSKQD